MAPGLDPLIQRVVDERQATAMAIQGTLTKQLGGLGVAPLLGDLPGGLAELLLRRVSPMLDQHAKALHMPVVDLSIAVAPQAVDDMVQRGKGEIFVTPVTL